ncbi:growth arrest-specific protein 1 [Hyperolius riggenbachi]|uniref:growth arrest-specific protein 1 n=1 Tax=Hyperolius riggenbachi TaxID=752182 RepID=UPI0035A3C472
MAGWRVPCTLLLASLLGVTLGRRLICYQAMLQCELEPECNFAYRQYSAACAGVLPRVGEPMSFSSSHRQCPSHCISALVHLNNTRGGPALEDCDCGKDDRCKADKRAIEPCIPRTNSGGGEGGGGGRAGGRAVMGCMEARKVCDADERCHNSLQRYLSNCGRLFNGRRCTDNCLRVIQEMMRVPKALLLNDCVCDGSERAICETVKENMGRLCFGMDIGPGMSGGSDDYYDEEDEEEEEPQGKEEEAPRRNNEPTNGCAPTSNALVTLGTCIIVLKLLLLG